LGTGDDFQYIMRSFILTGLIIFVLLPFGLVSVATAQDGQAGLDSSADFTFGKELRFMLSVDNAADVERVTLSFRPEFAAEKYVVDVPFEASDTISVTYPVDVTMINLRPFSQLKYSWQLDTSNGSRSIPEQSIIYEDNQFQWLQTEREAATLHWTGNGPEFGSEALNVVDGALLDLVSVIPLESIIPFDVYVYPSSAELRTGLELAGLDGDKVTHPDLGVIFVTAVNPQSAVSDLGQSIPYELAHLLLYQAAGEHYDDFPWWMSEGLGMLFQTEANPSYEQKLDEAVHTESTIPLWQLCESPEVSGNDNILSRAQSASTVFYIRNRYGDQKLEELVQSYARGNDCQIGVQRVLGMSLDQLEEAWLTGYGSPSPIIQILNDTGLWALLLLGGFILALIIIRHSTRGRS
jgi:hypothetical protein